MKSQITGFWKKFVYLLSLLLFVVACDEPSVSVAVKDSGKTGDASGLDTTTPDAARVDGATGDRTGFDGAVPDRQTADSAGSFECQFASDCTSPNQCENAAGATCVGNVCFYPPKGSSIDCNDGDLCTQGDSCDGLGGCGGTEVVCGAVPAPECVDNNSVYRSYSGDGTCNPQTGTCFTEHDIACPQCDTQCEGVCQGVSCPVENGGCRVGATCIPDPPGNYTCEHLQNAQDGTVCDQPGSSQGAQDGYCLSGSCVACSQDAHCPQQCTGCSAQGSCDLALADDATCNINCAQLNEDCRAYRPVTANRCAGLGQCKTVAQACVDYDIRENAVCRVAVNDCDQEERCTAQGDCPADIKAPPNQLCGVEPCQACDGNGQCNLPATDDPACQVSCSSHNTTCRTYQNLTADRCASFGVCKTGSAAECTQYTDVTGSCSDGNDCTNPDVCFNGSCAGGPDEDTRSDGDVCGQQECGVALDFCGDERSCQPGCYGTDVCQDGACVGVDDHQDLCTNAGFVWIDPWLGRVSASYANCCGDDSVEYGGYYKYASADDWDTVQTDTGVAACCDSASQCVNTDPSYACFSLGSSRGAWMCAGGVMYECDYSVACQKRPEIGSRICKPINLDLDWRFAGLHPNDIGDKLAQATYCHGFSGGSNCANIEILPKFTCCTASMDCAESSGACVTEGETTSDSAFLCSSSILYDCSSAAEGQVKEGHTCTDVASVYQWVP